MRDHKEFLTEIYRRYDIEHQKQKKRRRAALSCCALFVLCATLAVPFTAYFFAENDFGRASESVSNEGNPACESSEHSSSIFEYFDFGSISGNTDGESDGLTGEAITDGNSNILTEESGFAVSHIAVRAGETNRVWVFTKKSDIESVLSRMLEEIRDESMEECGYTLEVVLASGATNTFYYPDTDAALETFLNELEGE